MRRVTFYPAVLPSADPIVIDAVPGEPLSLLNLRGVSGLPVNPLTIRGPGQEGETALDVTIPPRIIVAEGLVNAADMAGLWAARAAVARAMINIPVRFGGELSLGRLLFERDGQDDVEIYAMPRSGEVEFIQAPHRGRLDAEWLCPYPYFQDTVDSTQTVKRLITLQTSAAADDIIDATAHDFAINDPVAFITLTGGTGLSVGTTYYVVAASFGANTFRVSATLGGAAIDFSTDITAGTVARVNTLVNSGDVDAPILAKLYGPATEVTLTNLTTGVTFTVAVTLASSSQWLEVDTSPGVKTVRKYTAAGVWSNAISGLSYGSRLWLMQPGNSSVRYSVVGGGAGSQAVLTWRNRYGGI